MAISDDFGFYWELYMYMYTVYMIFLKLHHSGTQFFRGNVDCFFDPEIRQLHSPEGVSTVKTIFFAESRSTSCGAPRDLK